MSDTANIVLALERHPDSTASALRRIEARVMRTPDGVLDIKYALEGDLERLRLPEMRAPRIGQRLWEHSCFEVFIGRPGFPGYHEFNFAPSGEWAAYAFAGYRQAAPADQESIDPHIEVCVGENHFELEATLHLVRLSSAHVNAKLSLSVSAVIEDQDGALSYWALKHPPGKPDFHHADAFVLRLG